MRTTHDEQDVTAWVVGSRVPLRAYVLPVRDLQSAAALARPDDGPICDAALEATLDDLVPIRIFSLHLKTDLEFRIACKAWAANIEALAAASPVDSNRLAKALAVLAFQPGGVEFGRCFWRVTRG